MVIVNRDGPSCWSTPRSSGCSATSAPSSSASRSRSWCPDRFSGMHMAFRSGYVSEPRTRPMGLAGDLHARRKDGSEFPVEVTLSPLETDEGLLVSAAVRDISERRRMQEENDRVKDEFFATVSHELRTPLTSMIGYGELMTDLEELSPQGQRFLSVIVRSAERELRLVDDLLTLVAIEESGLAIRSAEIDLERVVREAVEAARPRAEEAQLSAVHGDPRDRRTHVRRPRPPRPGHGQPALQRDQVHPARRLACASSCARARPRAEIDVIDTGVGIGDEDPDALFERLFRSQNAVAQQTPGAGLGLTIALAIVEAHAGTIEVPRSGPEGTTFRMTFPLRTVLSRRPRTAVRTAAGSGRPCRAGRRSRRRRRRCRGRWRARGPAA